MKVKHFAVLFIAIILSAACAKSPPKPSQVFDEIVFMSDRGGLRKLYTMDSKGQKERALAKFKGEMLFPSFSPDGKKLMFFSYLGKADDICIIDATGKIGNITKTPDQMEKLANWSPDSKSIAYSGATKNYKSFELVVIDINNSRRKVLVAGKAPSSNPIFSPDGKRIYWTAQKVEMGLSEIATIQLDGKNRKQLTYNSVEDGVDSISPDGKWLTSSAVRDNKWEILIYSNDGRKQIQVTKNDFFDTRAFWQPSGNKILWQGRQDKIHFDTFVAEFPKLKIANLTYGNGNNVDGQWLPDGRIIFSSDRDGDYEIYIMNSDGTNVKQLTHNEYEDRMPVWRPN